MAPHQDDETLGCGALIARKRNDGLPVHVVFVTDGGASHSGHPSLSAREVGALRRSEALAALAILGVESSAIHFLDEADGTLHLLSPERRARLVGRLAELLGQVKPGEVFLPCRPDGSSEHDATFEFVCAALVQAGLRPDIWQYPVWLWWNPRLLIDQLLLGHHCCTQPAEDYHLIKTRALHHYRSQIEPTPPWPKPALPRELVRSCNSSHEFFFRFVLPPTGAGPASSPVI